MTAEDVAKRLGVHPRTVLRAIGRGDLEASDFGGSAGYRITEDQFQAWLQKRLAKPASSSGDAA